LKVDRYEPGAAQPRENGVNSLILGVLLHRGPKRSDGLGLLLQQADNPVAQVV
jgi:hypothetical protein